MRGELLSGGNMDPVIRIGDTVRRVSGLWSASVHELLSRYESAGVSEAPRPRGIDDEGREVLTFIEGVTLEQAPPETRWRPSILHAAGALLRELHDASVSLTTRDRVWRSESHSPAEVVCHNDFAPYNLIVREQTLVGVIDFDMASPGPRIWDFAYLAYRLAPFAEDADGFDSALYGSPASRLEQLIEAYGVHFTPLEVRQAAARRLDDLAVFTKRRAADTGRPEFAAHAAMYRRDAERCRSQTSLPTHARVRTRSPGLREGTAGVIQPFRDGLVPASPSWPPHPMFSGQGWSNSACQQFPSFIAGQ
jgi:aminoglycoside phosphotransferase (APT) family kinase protein